MSKLSGLTIHSLSNNRYQLTDELNRGGQGVIYGETRGEYVVKILFEKDQKEQTEIVKKLKVLNQIDLPARFIKPIDIVKFSNEDQTFIGYIMKRVKGHIPLNRILIPPREGNFGDWYNGKAGGLKRRLYLCYQIAQSFSLLHKNNLAYCDVSGGNVLVAENPRINSVCMIDIDNIYTPGSKSSGIMGTARYMSPEISNQALNPDVTTDDYSLAVILFELLRCGHPYVGDIIKDGSPEIEMAAYKGVFPYVDDEMATPPNHSSDILPSDVIFTEGLKRLFRKSFIDGRNNRMCRSTSKEFSIACLEASNALIQCQHCGAWYYPFSEFKEKDGYYCPWCSSEDDKNLNKVGSHLIFGELFPKISGNFDEPFKNWKPEKTFILHEGKNLITNNYAKRSLTSDDYVTSSNTDEIEGNIKTFFEIIYEPNKNTFKLTNRSTKKIYVYGNTQKLQEVEPDYSFELHNGDGLYLDTPPKKYVHIDDVLVDHQAAVGCRIALLRQNS